MDLYFVTCLPLEMQDAPLRGRHPTSTAVTHFSNHWKHILHYGTAAKFSVFYVSPSCMSVT